MQTASNNPWFRAAIPAFTWLRNYQRGWVRMDLVAGVTLPRIFASRIFQMA